MRRSHLSPLLPDIPPIQASITSDAHSRICRYTDQSRPSAPPVPLQPSTPVSLVADGSVHGDTAGVDGDVSSGIWEFDGRLYAPRVKQSLNVAVLTGAKGPGIQVVSVTIRVAELLAREKACPNRHQYVVISDSRAAIQLKLVVTCSIKLSLDRFPQAVGVKGSTINSHNRNNASDVDLKRIRFLPREDLERLHGKAKLMPDNDDGKARQLLVLLGARFHALYNEEHAKADLERAISILEESMQGATLSRPLFGMHTGLLATALLARFEHSGDRIDIERAVSYSRTALRFTEDLGVAKSLRFSGLGGALQLRFGRFGGLVDLENSILCQREAIRAIPDSHPYKLTLFSNLGCSLQSRFEHLGSLANLEDAIFNHRQVVQLRPDSDPRKPKALSDLGIALQLRFERLGGLADLEDATSNFQRAVRLTPDSDPDKAQRFNHLGVALNSRFERLGILAGLEDGILNFQRAVQRTPDGHPFKPSQLSNLGLALRSRFERLGNLTDLEDAISNQRRAVQLALDGHPDNPSLFSNLGVVLQSRFQRLGGLADLENAIQTFEQAVQLTPDGHPDKPGRYNNLGQAFLSLFGRLGVSEGLEDAISNFQQAVRLVPDSHPTKPSLSSSLGIALQLRFNRLGGLTDLQDAISTFRQAVQLTPDGHTEQPSLLNNLGLAFQAWFERLGSLVDLEDAILHLRQAVRLLPDGHPSKPGRLHNLGVALMHRFRRLGILSDLESVLSALSTAANSIIGPDMVRFRAARAWAKFAEEQSRSPLDAFNCAINLLPRIAWLGLAVPDQHALLADGGDIVRDAVAAAIRHEEYETAVVWAEQGRSIVWQNLLGLRSPIEDLRETHPELADRLHSVAKQLEGSESNLEVPTASVGDVSLKSSKPAVEWDNIVEEVRRIPRFEGFLKPKSFQQLAPAAHEGPVVILNVNDAQCDALVLISDNSVERKVSAVHIPLERFSYEKSKKMFQTLTELLSSAGVRERTGRKTGRVQSQMDGEAKFKAILGILWTDVVKPVIEALAFQIEPKRSPRIWWCATGLLAFLPIHAAGLYDMPEVGERLSDYVISSYTPTLTAILDLSDPVLREDFQVLTVAQASAPGAQSIPKTEDEVRIIQGLATSARVLNLTGKNATVERVRKGMMESNWIHLACHGKQNPDDPMESGFLLHDRALKLSEIVKMTLPKTDFAFLSACQTAMGNEHVAEESVHLAAGMFLSECRGVIATTWSIRDEDAPKIAEDVYSRMFKDGKPNRKEAAYALHEAVKRLKESGARCTSWVPFIHIGW